MQLSVGLNDKKVNKNSVNRATYIILTLDPDPPDPFSCKVPDVSDIEGP